MMMIAAWAGRPSGVDIGARIVPSIGNPELRPIVALTLSWVLFVHAKELLDEANRRQTRRDGPLVGAPITLRLVIRHSQSASFITHSEGGRPLTRSALNSLLHIGAASP
jgi:hypothetical protein